MGATIDDLPDELLEHILSIISQYRDLDNCLLVSRKWNYAAKRVAFRKKYAFINALAENKAVWEYENCEGQLLRYNHSACYYDNTYYVFGGFSKNHTTAFNDLIAFDLTTRSWNKIQGIKGRFPQPKAGAAICGYKDKLILCGGCVRPSQPRAITTFSELHTFDIKNKVWTCIEFLTSVLPSVTCHSVTVHGNKMVICGGLKDLSTELNLYLYCLNLDTWEATVPECKGNLPPRIYGASQIYLDDQHFLFTGGWRQERHSEAAQPNALTWLLSMAQTPWVWSLVREEHPEWAPPHRAFKPPVSRVGDHVVSFCRCRKVESIFKGMEKEWGKNKDGPAVKTNSRHIPLTGEDGPPNLEPHHNVRRKDRRQRQLMILKKFEQKLGEAEIKPEPSCYSALYFGSIRDVKETLTITWTQPQRVSCYKPTRLFHSQTVARSEIIIFGGLPLRSFENFDDTPDDEMTANDSILSIFKAPRSFL